MRTLLSAIFFLTMMNSGSAQTPTVHYTLGMQNPSTHLFEVEVTYGHLPQDLREIDFILPVWRPGRYYVLDFASGVQEVAATDGHEKSLSVSKIGKSQWRVLTGNSGTVTLRYRVYANEFNLRTRGLNDEHAFVDGSAVFMYTERYRNLPVNLTIRPWKDWHVTTGLEGRGTEFTAPDYDYLVDCPIEIGTQHDLGFTVDGVPHVLSIFGEGNWNGDTLVHDIAKIVKVEKDFWGEFPYKRYVFLLHCTPSSGGGTEHINSTAMGTRPFIFRNPDSYRSFLGLVAHEFFHTWNVKQLRPHGIHPYDYTRENYSKELWVAEGTTSYYDEILLIPSGFMTAAKYLEKVATAIQNDRQRPGNTVQPLADASFDAWVKYWKGTEQGYNSESDYYSKGADVSLLLDLEIRHRSSNQKSLDDVLRTMYKLFPLSGSGYTLDDFRTVSEEISGGALHEFFSKFIYGTTPLPWEEVLSYAGLRVVPNDSVKSWIGLSTSDVGEKTKVTRVVAGSPSYDAGLDVGDEILALNGYRVRMNDLNDRVANSTTGEQLTLTVFRNDRLRKFTVTAGHNPVPAYKIVKAGTPTVSQQRLYEGWLRTPWEERTTH